MNYSFIIDEMTWSYSRIKCYQDCPYCWFLKYIKKLPNKKMFFSSYGSFCHEIFSLFYKGKLQRDEAKYFYLQNYLASVSQNAPNDKVYTNYFNQGVKCFENLKPLDGEILTVEKKDNYEIEGYRFVGYRDLTYRKDGIKLLDHKSKDLKERSKKGTLKTDKELDDYLRQLYLYCVPIYEEFREYPNELIFNCYRLNRSVSEPFNEDVFADTKKWATDCIKDINNNQNWEPNLNFWNCFYLCDMCEHCEYKKLANWKEG